MRLLPLALFVAALPAVAAPKDAAPAATDAPAIHPMVRTTEERCKRPEVHQAETSGAAEHRKLGELPPGDLVLSVYNQVEGCMEPVIVRYGDGRPAPEAGQPEPLRPRARIWR